MRTANLRFWHYTSAFRLPQIFQSGKINLDKQAKAFGEKPAVWISTNSVWENTATKMVEDENGNLITLTKEEMCLRVGLGRIEIKPSESFISWSKFGTTSRINPKLFNSMTQVGIGQGANPNEWFASYIPIISRYFISIEMNIEGKWVKCPDWNKLEQFVNEGMETNRALLDK